MKNAVKAVYVFETYFDCMKLGIFRKSQTGFELL